MENRNIISRNGQTINVVEWKAINQQAVLIIAHGASEHIYRYKKLATFLNKHNISVVGYNHAGHKERRLENHQGVYFGNDNGDKLLVSDLEDVCLNTYQNYEDIPLFVMGHSMGSLIVRMFAMNTRLKVDGMILCGTMNPSIKIIKPGKSFAKFLYTIFGKERYSKKLNKMVFGSLEKRISYNNDNIDNYKSDQDCGLMFSNKAIFDLLSLTEKVIDLEQINKLQKTNYLIIVGKEDLFSNKTKDLEEFISSLKKHNYSYKYISYDNMKHEILHEDNKEKVYQNILEFIAKK